MSSPSSDFQLPRRVISLNGNSHMKLFLQRFKILFRVKQDNKESDETFNTNIYQWVRVKSVIATCFM